MGKFLSEISFVKSFKMFKNIFNSIKTISQIDANLPERIRSSFPLTTALFVVSVLFLRKQFGPLVIGFLTTATQFGVSIHKLKHSK